MATRNAIFVVKSSKSEDGKTMAIASPLNTDIIDGYNLVTCDGWERDGTNFYIPRYRPFLSDLCPLDFQNPTIIEPMEVIGIRQSLSQLVGTLTKDDYRIILGLYSLSKLDVLSLWFTFWRHRDNVSLWIA